MKKAQTVLAGVLLVLVSACGAEEPSDIRDYNTAPADGGASSSPAAPENPAGAGPSTPETPDSQAPAPTGVTGDPSRFNTVVTIGNDPTWCGPMASYLQNATEKGAADGMMEADSDESVARSLEAAEDARDAASIPGLPEDLKSFLLDNAKLNTRIAETRGELTDEDNELGRKVLGSLFDVYGGIAERCPETAEANADGE